MRTLHLFLERGFSGEAAVVELQGREVFRSHSLPSDLMMGFSAQVDVPLDGAGASEAAVELPRLGERHVIPLPPGTADLWVAVRRTPEGMTHEVGTEPRGYL